MENILQRTILGILNLQKDGIESSWLLLKESAEVGKDTLYPKQSSKLKTPAFIIPVLC